MTRWEYRTEHWEPDPKNLREGTEWLGFDAWLNARGAEGWELFRATSQHKQGFVGTGGYRGESCLFRRAK